MPNWKTHLEVAKRLNSIFDYKDDDYILFQIGSILPDINNGILVENVLRLRHRTTHFLTEDRKGLEVFRNEYASKLDNPLIKGYLIHLLTDRFFNEYFEPLYEYTNERKHHDFNMIEEKFNDNIIERVPKIDDYIIKEIYVNQKNLEDAIKNANTPRYKKEDYYLFDFENEYVKCLNETIENIKEKSSILPKNKRK